MLLVAVALLAVVAADAAVAAAVLQFVADVADAFNRTSGHKYPLFLLEAAASHRNSRSARKLAMAMGIWHLASLVSNHITWCADHLRMRHK